MRRSLAAATLLALSFTIAVLALGAPASRAKESSDERSFIVSIAGYAHTSWGANVPATPCDLSNPDLIYGAGGKKGSGSQDFAVSPTPWIVNFDLGKEDVDFGRMGRSLRSERFLNRSVSSYEVTKPGGNCPYIPPDPKVNVPRDCGLEDMLGLWNLKLKERELGVSDAGGTIYAYKNCPYIGPDLKGSLPPMTFWDFRASKLRRLKVGQTMRLGQTKLRELEGPEHYKAHFRAAVKLTRIPLTIENRYTPELVPETWIVGSIFARGSGAHATAKRLVVPMKLKTIGHSNDQRLDPWLFPSRSRSASSPPAAARTSRSRQRRCSVTFTAASKYGEATREKLGSATFRVRRGARRAKVNIQLTSKARKKLLKDGTLYVIAVVKMSGLPKTETGVTVVAPKG